MKYMCIVLLQLILISYLHSQDKIIGTNTMIYATFNHISVQVDFAGDVNMNSSCTIEYKAINEPVYKASAKVMRAHPAIEVDGNMLNRNHYAASVMFLEAGTSYDIRVSLQDPENDAVIIEEYKQTTKSYPTPADDGRMLYVAPGNGGGTGSVASPFLGLQEAADQAMAGDIFIVMPGHYTPFGILNSGEVDRPIVFKSQYLHQAIIDGNNGDRGIITLGEFDVSASNHVIDGFIIQNGTWGIDAQNTSFLTVTNNIVRDVDFGFVNRRENNGEHDQYVSNNVFEGRTQWPQINGEIPEERAIDIRGNNHVISHNTISNFGDGISCDGSPYVSSFSLDIHDNEITNIVDDIIEIDGNVSNTRVYNNRGFNGRMGVSVAPIFGGPVYVFRNVFYNLEISTFKMNRGPSGLVIAHNMGIKAGNGMSSDEGWDNTFVKNNILMGTRYCFEEYAIADSLTNDWDYNAYYSSRSGTPGNEWFKWQNVRYANIQDLATNTAIESHGIATSLADLNSVFMPQLYSINYDPADQDHTLSENSTLINVGTELSNINIPYVTDGMPDIGPYEYGQDIPMYGANFDISSSVIQVEAITYRFYPNPCKDVMNIESEKPIDEVNIYNIQGRMIATYEANGGSTKQFNVSMLKSGIYWLELKYSNQTISQKSKLVKI